MGLYNDASLIMYPSGYKSGKIYCQKPTDGSGDLTFTRASTATRVNESGLIEAVASGVPRIDFTGGGCGKLLLEPQRTNLVTYSEQFDNAAWSKDNVTITANSVTSPSGYQDADTLTDTTANTRHRVNTVGFSFTAGTAYTFSVFVKKESNGRFLLLNAATAANARAILNLDTLAITNLNGTGKVEDYGNGWYRFSVTGTAPSTLTAPVFIQMQNDAADAPYVGNGSSFYLWGVQLEVGSYPTSYIPTAGSTVTRVKDLVSSFAPSEMVGVTNFTLVFDNTDTVLDGTGEIIMQINGSSGALRYYATNGGRFRTNTYFGEVNTVGKVAIKWDGSLFTMFLNGVKSASTNATTIGTFVNVENIIATANAINTLKLSSYQLYPTALSDAQLLALTTL